MKFMSCRDRGQARSARSDDAQLHKASGVPSMVDFALSSTRLPELDVSLPLPDILLLLLITDISFMRWRLEGRRCWMERENSRTKRRSVVPKNISNPRPRSIGTEKGVWSCVRPEWHPNMCLRHHNTDAVFCRPEAST